jgi:serralysin
MTILNGTGLGDSLRGTSLSDFIYGLGGDDILYGNGGDDRLYGGGGSDQMFGGSGDDTYYVDAINDVVDESAAEGTDLVASSISWTLGANLENLTLTGVGGSTGTGNALANIVRGNSAANILSGEAGNDSLLGGAGNDRLYGGTGNDSAQGGPGDDLLDGGAGEDTASYTGATARVLVDLSISGPQDTEGAGTDTLVSIERLNGSSFDDSLIGNDAANKISGGAGNDYLTGGGGADRLTGGAGSDYFYYDRFDSGDVLTDFVSGTDHIDLYIMWGLQFTFIDDAAFSGTAGEGRFHNGLFELDYDGDGRSDLSFTVNGDLVAADIIAQSPWDY